MDLITYGFPCQDISLAGKQVGFADEDGNKTRSGLFFDAARLIKFLQPKFAIAENVKNLVSKKFKAEFETVLETLSEVNYNNYYAVLNAKHFGIPQNRERVFIVSIRKDIDKGMTFPSPVPLELKLRDMLDTEVDNTYYLTNEQIERLSITTYVSGRYENRVTERVHGGLPWRCYIPRPSSPKTRCRTARLITNTKVYG